MGVERPAIGRVIGGKYRIERALGAGAWAQVYLAEHIDLHSKVAIKLLSNWESSSEKQLGRFLREARAAARLKTVHVCKVLDVGRTEEGAPFTVLEHLDGTDFQHVVDERGRLDPATAVAHVLQVCEGLAEAHANGIVHRDLKPANLFLTAAPDGSPLVKILDFGISKELSGHKIDIHLTRSTDLLGTPFYMSPEQLRDAADVDARTDIWSMGVILWRMLSGVMPFEGGSFAELCVSIMTGPPPSRGLEHIPSGLHEPLARCLEKDPARRFQNCRQLAAALSHWLNGEESSTVSRISRVLARVSGAEATARGPAEPALTPPRAATPPRALTPVPAAAGPVAPIDLQAAPPPGWRRPLIIAAVVAGLAMAVAAAILLISGGDDPDGAGRDQTPAPAATSAPPPAPGVMPGAPARAPGVMPEAARTEAAPAEPPPAEPPAAAATPVPATTPPPAAPAPHRPAVRRGAGKRKPPPPPPAEPTDLYDRRH